MIDIDKDFSGIKLDAEIEYVTEPKRHYKVTTGHGSVFSITFQPWTRLLQSDGQSYLYGDMYLEGRALSLDRYIRFAGEACELLIGGHITVSPYLEAEDGREVRDSEMITDIHEIPIPPLV